LQAMRAKLSTVLDCDIKPACGARESFDDESKIALTVFVHVDFRLTLIDD